MKTVYILTLILIFGVVQLSAQNLSINDNKLVEEIVAAKAFILDQNIAFKDPEHSPLHDDSIIYFKGLDYFAINPVFIVKAEFQGVINGRKFEMKTSTDRLPVYIDYALVKFEINGKKHQLHIYQNVELSKKEGYEDYLFLPFTDQTNGFDTYGGGRYMDLRIPEGHEIILNFNISYNPYCAYNDKYSCPIPPEENKLEIPVRAGIKTFH